MSSTVKALVFDVYGTMFDVLSISEACEEKFPGKGEEVGKTWHSKQMEYLFLHQLMGKYIPFSEVTKEALRFSVKEHAEEELDAAEEQGLFEAFLRLAPYPEVADMLGQLKGKELSVFSNGSHNMLDPLVENAGYTSFFSGIISVDEIKQFKPSLYSYQYLLNKIGLKHEEVLFVSSNNWDVAGAKNFGFQTAWINRKKQTVDELGLDPDFIFDDLTGLLKWK
ncbi:haloacid dehalogenase type II [Planomicrobium sp. CPCC 101110]|uniref:haloacid dehalogenase type II n=1 Tax=Planomicrobium sp. CPCC 101110 TaxID=2599619 RepID=UPI0011B3FC09|nr:haloacid dehalogenase type II [Planomicrobium sp. CPCC 101110]TWT25975.1 haloacid dehalogenase type II [Planomicrobium sp. CPCC 101110]